MYLQDVQDVHKMCARCVQGVCKMCASHPQWPPSPDTKFHNNREPKGTINNIDEIDDDDEDNVDNEVDDPLYAEIYRASESHEDYKQAVREFEKHEEVVWKNVPNGAYQKQLREVWEKISINTNSRGEKIMILDNQRYIVPPPAVQPVLEILDLTHAGLPKAIGSKGGSVSPSVIND